MKEFYGQHLRVERPIDTKRSEISPRPRSINGVCTRTFLHIPTVEFSALSKYMNFLIKHIGTCILACANYRQI